MAEELISFGAWVRLRRQALVLSREELASRIGVAEVTVRKIEADERRPSPQVAALLAGHLELDPEERGAFVLAARGQLAVAHLPPPILRAAQVAQSAPASGRSLPARGLPSGAVTFLFSDIEGSTRLWEQHPQAMQSALAAHDALLHTAISDHGGAVVKGTGDGLCAAFARPSAAVAAAVAAQQALRAHAWNEVGPLQVRMALHTGVAEEREGDYFGPTLNRVARLLEAGHGGQVLATRTTCELARDELAAGVTLRDLGQYQLRDLSYPEHIFQVVAPHLPEDFPTLRTAATRPGNLPAPLEALIGRRRELDELVGLLTAGRRLVTLTGTGGTGKTQLALAVAHALQRQFADGAWFVDLSAATVDEHVAAAIAQTLGLAEARERPGVERLREWLGSRQILLLLDNFEQVVDAAPLITTLLQTARQLSVLVTSRIPLRIASEHEYAVPPLALPASEATVAEAAAVQLFLARSAAVGGASTVTDASAAAVAAICRRLDGLPLALELAAARSKLFPPAALLARLESFGALSVLTGGRRDLPERQQTVRSTVAWSYELLGPDERELFARLAVFAGGWDLEAAETVCGANAGRAVADTLAALVDHSLVKVLEASDAGLRFSFLETIREFAQERLSASAEQEDMRRRHATYYAALVEQLTSEAAGYGGGRGIARLEMEHDNLRAALAWALDAGGDVELGVRLTGGLMQFWWARGYWSEGWAYLERAAHQATAASLPARGHALMRAGWFASGRGDYPRAETLLHDALAAFRSESDAVGVGRTTAALASTASAGGDYSRAASLLQEALELFRTAGDRYGEAFGLRELGHILRARADPAGALEALARSDALYQELGVSDPTPQFMRAEVLLDMGEFAEARTMYRHLLDAARSRGNDDEVAGALRGLGRAAHAQGDVADAVEALEVSVALARAAEREESLAWTLHHLGAAMFDAGDHERAAALLHEALVLQQREGNRHMMAESLEIGARFAAERHAFEGAARLLGASDALREVGGTPRPARIRLAYERLALALRDRLGATAFDAAWQGGREAAQGQGEGLVGELTG